LRGIARQFAVSEDALTRHVSKGHIIAKLTKAVKAQEIVEANDLLKEIQKIQDITDQIIDSALSQTTTIETEKGKKIIDTPDHKTALKGIDTRGKQIELKGKVLGAFRDKPDQPGPTALGFIEIRQGKREAKDGKE
jgi:hypothetical protein